MERIRSEGRSNKHSERWSEVDIYRSINNKQNTLECRETYAPRKEPIMRTVIQTLLQKDDIEKVQNTNSPGHYSILFLRKKTSGEYRPIIDLKELNKIIENYTSKMESSRSIQNAMKKDQMGHINRSYGCILPHTS